MGCSHNKIKVILLLLILYLNCILVVISCSCSSSLRGKLLIGRSVSVSAGQRSPCARLSPAGIRKKEQLVTEEEEERGEAGGEEEEESRRKMDISLLREQYRCTRETQKRRTQVLLLRTGERKLNLFVYLLWRNRGPRAAQTNFFQNKPINK